MRKSDDSNTIQRNIAIAASVILLLVALYAGVAVYYAYHFLPNTTVNGIDVSGADRKAAEEKLRSMVDTYELTLVEREVSSPEAGDLQSSAEQGKEATDPQSGTEQGKEATDPQSGAEQGTEATDLQSSAEQGTEAADGAPEKNKNTIFAADVDMIFEPGEDVSVLMSEQKYLQWITAFSGKQEIQGAFRASYNEDKVKALVKDLSCMQPEKQVAPKSAYPRFEKDQFVIAPEEPGTTVVEEKLVAAIGECLSSMQRELDLGAAGCYAAPTFLSDAPEVAAARDEMNHYLEASITYRLNPDTEKISKKKIGKWLKTDENMQVIFREDKIASYIEELAGKCNIREDEVEFLTKDGETIRMSGKNVKLSVDQAAELTQLLDDIRNARTVERVPLHSTQMNPKGAKATYAEVDISKQKMWFYKDGKKVVESDVVTGNPNRGRATPEGVYRLTYKTKDRVLRGDKKEDGTWGYESPVKFWMPFNGGIGFHDASWQPVFGGQRYLANGSHGCVNMPYKNAKKLYENIQSGDLVVVHE